ncbi:hypothetical protein [Nocardioides sp. Soil805]|uniref:hypothetical protein n=1 Tax=Nocardioides sp. Soil805 TaxID=1736416 RepID=UPI0007029E4B|nr:hypothetical protein [Nocardioides sp. Soil805]KRF35331.1 hypothetical protein ASG94_14625 [Nocardioides sp. Soil805]
MELDDLLDAAAAPVTPRTSRLRDELRHLVLESEAAQRRPAPLRLALAGGVAASVLGLGTVAAAAGLLPGWTLLTTSSGQSCQVAVQADPRAPGDGEPSGTAFGRTKQDETLAAARAFLEDLDYAAIDRQDAIAEWRVAEDGVLADQDDPAERAARLVGDDLEVTAVTRVVVERMRTALEDQGLDIRAIAVTTTSSGCDL